MTHETEIFLLLRKLAVPIQDLAQVSFCRDAKPAAIKEWLSSLPLTQAQQVSAPLYQAVHEISRVNINSDQRLAILELLRVPVYQTLDGLAGRYLNQPLIMPEAALKTATIAQAIQKHFFNGYLILVRQLCDKPSPKSDINNLQALVIHRALTALGLLLLRSYQLYLPIANQVWEEIHALYRLARILDLTHLPVEDDLPHQQAIKTIQNQYLRIVLLAAAKPNQLRQDEIDNTYKLLETLAASAELEPYVTQGQENLYVVLTHSNRPPLYKSHWRPAAAAETTMALELRTTHIISRLSGYKPGAETASEKTLPYLNVALATHLENAWSHMALRSFTRQEINAEIEITVGLTSIHFHLADQQAFNVFLKRSSGVAGIPEKDNIFQKRGVQLKKQSLPGNDDPWGDAFDVAGATLEGKNLPTLNIEKTLLAHEKETYHGQHPIHKIPLVDRSPGGYGLEWRGEIPLQVRAGELLGLREYGRNKWSIGVVRWVHQIKGATQLGIQILAPQAVPVAIAVVHKTGAVSEYLRALQIPELRAVNQATSLITNAVSFHEYHKARLYRQAPAGERDRGDLSIQLTQRIFATGAFSQFAFRELMNLANETSGKDDFNSVWE